MQIKKLLVMVLAVGVLFSTLARAAEDEPSEQVKRLNASAAVLDEIMKTPDKGIPEEILGSAECVAVIPSMVKIGFIFGGRHGRGLATCRTKSGGWSAPAPFSVTGGSWGLQIGGEAVGRHDDAGPAWIPEVEHRGAQEHAPVGQFGAAGFDREGGQLGKASTRHVLLWPAAKPGCAVRKQALPPLHHERAPIQLAIALETSFTREPGIACEPGVWEPQKECGDGQLD